MFLASLSSCHMLWFLHFCSAATVIVLEYAGCCDCNHGWNQTDGNGKFTEVVLHPRVKVKEAWMMEKLNASSREGPSFLFHCKLGQFSREA